MAISEFFDWTADTSADGGGGQALVLGINDMSLFDGGLFDICNTWQRGHTYHRIGASVDVDSRAVLFDNPETLVNLQPYQVNQLTAIMRLHQGTRFPEEPLHYGFGGR
ncbi:MAG: hypothetical protein ACREBU_17545 [Nitrososphaera sp.]